MAEREEVRLGERRHAHLGTCTAVFARTVAQTLGANTQATMLAGRPASMKEWGLLQTGRPLDSSQTEHAPAVRCQSGTHTGTGKLTGPPRRLPREHPLSLNTRTNYAGSSFAHLLHSRAGGAQSSEPVGNGGGTVGA